SAIFMTLPSVYAIADGTALYSQLPNCAKPCHVSASQAIGCDLADLKCLCQKQERYAAEAKGCIMGTCWI
ncbi:uncharacterized protein BCR38DRAFT_307566, partial [Pseudomassariella vexata]